ncbi:Myb-like protein I [Galdieria sulphuraria]|nr:Myb-like protein I [Galdieria sulphuraria]
MDTQSPYSVQQTYMYSERNPSDADPFELVDSDLYSDYLSFPNQSGEAANNNAATDTSTRPWDDSGKNICPYSASVHELYSNLPFWQNVIAKSSWRLHRAKTPWEGLGFEREGFVESSNDVDNNDGLCKDENVLDVDNIESTEDLETALMEYFQRKPGFTSLNEADTFPLLQSSSSPSSFRM